MVNGKKRTSAAVITGLAHGTAYSILITVAACMIMAKTVETGKVKETQIGYIIMGILFVASFTGAKKAYHNIKSKKLIIMISQGFTYLTILLIITALFFGGQYNGVIASAFVILAGNISAFFLNKQNKKKGRALHTRKQNR